MESQNETHSASIDGDTLCIPSRRARVAALKRVYEFWMLDQGFRDAYLLDPRRTLAATELNVDPLSVSLLLQPNLPGNRALLEGSPKDLPEVYVWHMSYVEERFRRNLYARTHELPKDRRFADWVLRQMRRCEREVGPRARFMMHYPTAFELSSGCSVGCPFCAFSAGRLEGVFRHTKENAALWQDVLARLHDVVGDAAGRGPCYYATEPLDNPDYELFLQDFCKEFGRVPQTTTAAATRNIERTRKLIRWGQEAYEHFDRLSVLSKNDLDLIVASFTPEELLFTDLLPQFAEAPAHNLTKAGRNKDADHGMRGTIACVSGFVINMRERSVRLVTPVPASNNYPTGELIYEKACFTDGASLENMVQKMIDRHMHQTIGLADILAPRR